MKTSHDSAKRFQRIYGKLEPWEFWVSREVTVEFCRRTDGKRLGEPVIPDSTGTFLIDLEFKGELAKTWRSEGAELRAVNKERHLLGITLLPASDDPLITVSVRMDVKVQRPDGVSMAYTLTPTHIISLGARRKLAEQVARLDGIEIRQAKAPRKVLMAIAELNEMSMLAVSLRTGRKDASALMRNMLRDIPIDNQVIPDKGSGPGAESGFAALTVKVGLLSDGLLPGRNCLAATPRALDVMQAAFALDFADKNKEPEWTKRAGAYIRQRLQQIESFAQAVRRTAVRGDSNLATGLEESMDHIIPPNEPDFPPGGRNIPGYGGTGTPGFEPGFDPGPIPGVDEPGTCDMLHNVCISLFVDVAAASLRDEYVDWITSVEPDCRCSNYNPNQVFIARPPENRPFPATFPSGVHLYFGNQIITQFSLVRNEIHFQIPPNAHSGPVYLRMLGQTPSEASRRLASACGNIMPDLPHEILFDRSPAAFLSIIYPPVIQALTANGRSGHVIAEACRPVDICWLSRLFDQSGGDRIVPCGSIRLTITEITGRRETTVVDTTTLSGCITVTAPEDRTYRAVAKSYADQTECATSAITDLVVQRVPHIRLSVAGNGVNEVLGGDTTRRFAIEIEISCPAPAGGVAIQLISSDPKILQVPHYVTLPEGRTKIEVALTTTALTPNDMCRTIQLMASASGYILDLPLDILVYRKPNLRWDGLAPAVSLCRDFSLNVFADCLPGDLSRVEFIMISPVWTDPHGQRSAESVHLKATNDSSNHYVLTIPPDEKQYFTKPGTWELQVQIGNPLRLVVSDAIHLEVVGGTISGSLTASSPSFDVCQSTTVEVTWNITAVQAIRLILDGNTLHEEGEPSAPLTTRCGSGTGTQAVIIQAGGARFGSQKQLILEGLSFEGTWQRLDALSLTGTTGAINPAQSYTIVNGRNDRIFIYTESNGSLVDRLEVQSGDSSSVPLHDCMPLIVRVYTETPPLTWPPAGHRDPPLWNPGSAQWVVQFPELSWCKMVTPGVTKVTGAPALIDNVF